MCVCLCLFDFLLHIRLQKKRTTAWHGRHGCPYPTHQPVCELVQQLAEQQALAETRCSPYTLTAIEHTGVIVLAHIQILASMFGRSQDCSNRVKKMGNQSHGKFMNKWLSVIRLLYMSEKKNMSILRCVTSEKNTFGSKQFWGSKSFNIWCVVFVFVFC